MDQITLRLDESLKDALDEEADEKGVSRSEYIRYILESRGEVEHLRGRLDAREERIEELEGQLRKRSNIEEKIEDLPAKIQSDLSWSEKRTRAYNNASVSERLLWRITGVPEDRIEDAVDEG